MKDGGFSNGHRFQRKPLGLRLAHGTMTSNKPSQSSKWNPLLEGVPSPAGSSSDALQMGVYVVIQNTPGIIVAFVAVIGLLYCVLAERLSGSQVFFWLLASAFALGGPPMAALLAWVQRFDFVLIDTPGDTASPARPIRSNGCCARATAVALSSTVR